MCPYAVKEEQEDVDEKNEVIRKKWIWFSKAKQDIALY